MNVNRDVGIILDLMFENSANPREWQFESDWSPSLARSAIERLEKEGLVEVERSDAHDWRIRQTAAGERAALQGAA